MAKNKTSETTVSVIEFLDTITDERKKTDCYRLIEIFQNETGFEPKMWGPSIIGFGSYHYKYDSGHEGDVPVSSFSPRKSAISLYISLNHEAKNKYLSKLGKHKTGKECIYVNKLSDIDDAVLSEMIKASVAYLALNHPTIIS